MMKKKCKTCSKNLIESRYIWIVKNGLICEDCFIALGYTDWMSAIPVNSGRGKELLKGDRQMDEKRIQELEKRPFTKIFPDAINDIKKGICPVCKKPVSPLRDWESIKEYNISRMCQECQDKIFGK